ncbi:predicted protein [Lodderomyces elongisporus NRRL YB-4239]|uniref:Uncharacterized protein n=1 Tax=Lodderomyces elongisporus (strain ATCC 11503 / CBS 2605 / JCM 1781 / NBRC 1676 / NRRL YB-4239) TaxID=379508 RepID=A5DYQ6_LODEL|nr:predicted protein [Lodderomyces elongisporus NRRL YB-4239]
MQKGVHQCSVSFHLVLTLTSECRWTIFSLPFRPSLVVVVVEGRRKKKSQSYLRRLNQFFFFDAPCTLQFLFLIFIAFLLFFSFHFLFCFVLTWFLIHSLYIVVDTIDYGLWIYRCIIVSIVASTVVAIVGVLSYSCNRWKTQKFINITEWELELGY